MTARRFSPSTRAKQRPDIAGIPVRRSQSLPLSNQTVGDAHITLPDTRSVDNPLRSPINRPISAVPSQFSHSTLCVALHLYDCNISECQEPPLTNITFQMVQPPPPKCDVTGTYSRFVRVRRFHRGAFQFNSDRTNVSAAFVANERAPHRGIRRTPYRRESDSPVRFCECPALKRV